MNLPIVTTQPHSFTAHELQKYLQRAMKNEFPILEHSSAPAIYLTLEDSPADRDHFSIRANGKSFFITGSNLCSVLYGVYNFLEQFLGIRFYAPDYEYIPQQSFFEIPSHYEYRQIADFKVRQIRLEWSFEPKMIDWIAKNRFNAVTADFWYWEKPEGQAVRAAAEERGLSIGASGHAMFYFLPADRYFQQHPEWFPEIEGRRRATANTGDNFCYSNPQAIEECAKNILAYCKMFPQIERINLWPGDGGLICRCPQCRQKTFMELYIQVVASIGRYVKKEYPKVQIAQLAYNFDLRDKNARPMEIPPSAPSNPTMFAFWGQNLSLPLAENPEPGHQKVYSYIRDFCERVPEHASIFCYHTDTYMNSNMCPVFEKTIPADFQSYKKLGIDDLCLLWIPWDEHHTHHTFWIAHQNAALWGRLAMDLHWDVITYRDDYYKTAYDPAQTGIIDNLWTRMNSALGKISALIFPFAPPRVSDAWGCGFSRDVMKWDISTNYGPAGIDRLNVFSIIAQELSDLNTTEIIEDNYPESRRFKAYIQHCQVRAQALAAIFQAQYALQNADWSAAGDLLQKAVDTQMLDEAVQTKYWLTFARERQGKV